MLVIFFIKKDFCTQKLKRQKKERQPVVILVASKFIIGWFFQDIFQRWTDSEERRSFPKIWTIFLLMLKFLAQGLSGLSYHFGIFSKGKRCWINLWFFPKCLFLVRYYHKLLLTASFDKRGKKCLKFGMGGMICVQIAKEEELKDFLAIIWHFHAIFG